MSDEPHLDNPQKDAFMRALREGKKLLHCPCCGRSAQMYDRTIHQSIARQLILLYRAGNGPHRDYVHTRELLLPGTSGVGDFSKAKYWQLVEEIGINENKKRRTSGLWRLTQKGVDYVTNRLAVPKHAYVYDDELWSLSDDTATIQDALGETFDYAAVMASKGIPV